MFQFDTKVLWRQGLDSGRSAGGNESPAAVAEKLHFKRNMVKMEFTNRFKKDRMPAMTTLPRVSRIVSLFLVLALTALLLIPALQALAQVGAVATVNTGRLNVRTGPGIQFGIITSIPQGTQVTLIGRAQGSTWVQVQLADGTQGWVNSIHLRTFANIPALPVTYNQPVPPPSSPPPAGPTVYVVRAGDTLQRIAARFGTTWQAIAAANNLTNPNRILVGQRLVIPTGSTSPPPSSPRVHVVSPGETLFRIALRYGVTVQAIAAANNISNPNAIYVGQTLQIPY
jgi:LysM repeat protein